MRPPPRRSGRGPDRPRAAGRGQRDQDAAGLHSLEQLGFSVTCVVNRREAADVARDGRFDLVPMDVQMPEMDGLEATRRIRTLNGLAA